MEKDDLWVLFRLEGSMYAVNSCCIEGIAREPEQITAVPEAEAYVRGIVKQRGKITTLIDLRKVFGIKATSEEYDEFSAVIEKAKSAHKKWVDELLKCIDEECPFCMEKDPHKCEFGRWYDQYEPSVTLVKNRLEKIRDPHYRLHKLGNQFDQELKKQTITEGLLKEIGSEAQNIEREILKCMDDTKEYFIENNRTMMITIKLHNNQSLALIVDEIVGVEQIGNIFKDTSFDKMEHSELVGNVAATMDGNELLLLIDEEKIYEMLAQSTVSKASESLAV